MLKLTNKVIISIKQKGIINTLQTVIRYPRSIIKKKKFHNTVLTLNKIEDRFTEIYKQNYWGSNESVSGTGSTLEYTINLRTNLPKLFKQFAIKSIFDAPCGDFNWMKALLKENTLNYIGGDIVAPLIASHNLNYKSETTKFIHINLINDKFPESDLMICRDCLFHLSFYDAKLVLQNFINSNIPYLLTTTHIETTCFQNKDIITGDFRLIDLYSSPYNLPKNVYYRIQDCTSTDPSREMCLWTREQIIDSFHR